MAGSACNASAHGIGASVTAYPAPAKLNLFLHVLGRRADGYHLLQTVFRLIDRCDLVAIEADRSGELLRLRELHGVSEADDLCMRAARILKDWALVREIPGAEELGARIALEKMLPLGGGLGGGSSDAATVLIVLNRLWGLDLSRGELSGLAASLGADVPFFVFGRPALGEGIGERLRALALPREWYVVLTPQVSVSTKEIFSDDALTRDSKPLTIPPFFAGSGRNDLEPVVMRRYAEVARHLSWLKSRVPGARMTGSGACVYAGFESEAEARSVAAHLPQDMRGFVACGLDEHPLQAMIPEQDQGAAE
jgi:4-diphosphocytidyl-2-C-methyl-D-erythritol kinase